MIETETEITEKRTEPSGMDIIRPENLVYAKPELMNDNPMHYCPGCSHGVIHKLIAEVIGDMGMEEKTVGVSPVGCAVFAYNYIDVDWVEAAHGRAPAVATAIKRVNPGKMVFTYQGDGDLAAIGTAETIHAANRGENIVIVFVNNAIYGMTGGQMAPTTLVGQKTTTCRAGRNMATEGGPVRMAEIMAQLDGVAYSARCSLHSVKHVRAAKKALTRAFEVQMQGLGFGFVEFLSGCPTNWHMDPVAANRRIAEAMIPVFPLGVYKDTSGTEEAAHG